MCLGSQRACRAGVPPSSPTTGAVRIFPVIVAQMTLAVHTTKQSAFITLVISGVGFMGCLLPTREPGQPGTPEAHLLKSRDVRDDVAQIVVRENNVRHGAVGRA
jgi:hypothetical protein